MKKIHFKSVLILIYVFGSYYLVTELDTYNECFIEYQDNYKELKLIAENAIQELPSNEDLIEKSRQVGYREEMLKLKAPNTSLIKYYWWVYILFGWSIILIPSKIFRKLTTTLNKANA